MIFPLQRFWEPRPQLFFPNFSTSTGTSTIFSTITGGGGGSLRLATKCLTSPVSTSPANPTKSDA